MATPEFRTSMSRSLSHVTAHSLPHSLRATRATRRALLLATLLSAAAGTSAIHAIGLDEVSQQSALGEPLRLVIPVLSAGDEVVGDEFAGECFKVVPVAANDLPQPSLARVALEHRAGRAFVVLTTAYPITEPIMRVAVQAGCRVSVSREYTLFFDPLSIAPPVVEPVMAASAPSNAESPAGAGAVAIDAPSPASATTPLEPPVVQRSVAPRKRAPAVARTKPDNVSKRSSQTAAHAPTALTRTAKSSNAPRLQVSRTVDYATATPVAGVAPTAAAEREALHSIEEQTVVLQRQIAELTLAMEGMQNELRLAQAARAEAEKLARTATERAEPAKPAPGATLRTWAEANWPLLVLFPALIVVVAALLVSKRRRDALLVPAPMTATQAEAFNPADLGEPSVPGPPMLQDIEAVVASSPVLKRPPVIPPPVVARPHVIPPPFVEPPSAAVPEFKYDPGLAFDNDVEQQAAESSAYSVLEREQPGIVARLTDIWGTPHAQAKLQDYLLTPRRAGRALSRGAIEELKLLHAIAVEQAGGLGNLPIGIRPGNGQLNTGARRM
jgi:hypothetical protein